MVEHLRGVAVSTSDAVIEVRDLTKVYRSGLFGTKRLKALDGVSLTVRRGQIYGLLGPNGAGKTTLIKILLGICRKTAGQAYVLGQPAGSRSARQQIGYLPENHRIPRHLTGDTALEYYGALSGLAVSEVRRRRPALLEMVGLAGRGRERVSGYSKGMLQRLGLAQAIIHNPSLIVLDEPTDGVDPVGRKEIRDVLRNLAAGGTTIFLNSHLLQEIELICEDVAILTKGKVRRTGSVKQLTQGMGDAPVLLQLEGDEDAIRKSLKLVQVLKFTEAAERRFSVELLTPSQQVLDSVIDQLRSANVSIWRIARREQTLEDAFIQIVGAVT